ncbi:FAD-dependent monooxygenase [Nonomuraea typhae]|uniref:FAD-dependent monooxygenase n=1 Tax=Nonomuraea typhae TaxID=2603600 RepID=A0ABW7Z9C2_9ACTN
MTLKVAIIGAGIGGLSAAAALLRKGVEVKVYEQAPELREVGVGLHLGSNGSRILRRWGLGKQLDEVAVMPAATEVRDWKEGRVLTRFPMGEMWAKRFGDPFYTIHRQDLHQLLAAQVPSELVRLNSKLVSYTDQGKSVEMEFADGTTAEADVLIGADGVHSVVRQVVAPPQKPTFSGHSVFRGQVPSSALPTDSLLIWGGPNCTMHVYPVRGGESLTFVAVVLDMTWELESWSAPGDPRDLAAAFADWNPEVKSVISAAVTDVRRWALYDREPLERWSAGRITLLGDAAHPMLPHLGQGANQAMEDGVALAHCLAAAPGEVAEALRRYESIRLPHTAVVQRGSRGGGTLKMRSDTGRDSLATMVEEVAAVQGYDIETELT